MPILLNFLYTHSNGLLIQLNISINEIFSLSIYTFIQRFRFFFSLTGQMLHIQTLWRLPNQNPNAF